MANQRPLAALAALEDEVRAKLHWRELVIGEGMDGKSLQRHTPFEACTLSAEERQALCVSLASSDTAMDRGMGCMVGMAVGDSVGAPLEFLDAADPGACRVGAPASSYSLRTNSYVEPFNKFQLSPGQWTDDASMGLCLADTILCRGGLDGADARKRFWSWWFRGLNNAFRKDMRREGSVGLGGNISRSLYTMRAGDEVTPRFNAEGEDAGNGSLMRLAPVPIAYRLDATAAAAAAAASSYTTHPGPMAAEACAFLATLCVRAMAEFDPQAESARAFLIRVADEYSATELAPPAATRAAPLFRSRAARLQLIAALDLKGGEAAAAAAAAEQKARGAARRGTAELRRLLLSSEPQGGLETCWNWRDAHLDVSGTLKRRGRQYNGYPVSAGYFGSFCLDGLAIALHAVAATASFSAAIERCVNFLGDADSTAAICGQIAGALYGYTAIDDRFKAQLLKWDDAEIALRAALLVARPVRAAPDDESPAQAKTVVAGGPLPV